MFLNLCNKLAVVCFVLPKWCIEWLISGVIGGWLLHPRVVIQACHGCKGYTAR